MTSALEVVEVTGAVAVVEVVVGEEEAATARCNDWRWLNTATKRIDEDVRTARWRKTAVAKEIGKKARLKW